MAQIVRSLLIISLIAQQVKNSVESATCHFCLGLPSPGKTLLLEEQIISFKRVDPIYEGLFHPGKLTKMVFLCENGEKKLHPKTATHPSMHADWMQPFSPVS